MVSTIRNKDTKYINAASYAMVDELSYETASTVIDSWESLRRTENYAEKTGRGLFIRFFEEEPNARTVFGFNEKDVDAIYDSQKFLDIGKKFIEIVDQVVDMLGPDLQTVAEVLMDLGKKYHTKYNMQPEYYSALARALIDQIEEILGSKRFATRTKSCWVQVYGALAKVISPSSQSTRIDWTTRRRSSNGSTGTSSSTSSSSRSTSSSKQRR